MTDALLLLCRLLWFVFVSVPAALHLSLFKPSVLSNLFLFYSFHRIAFHPLLQEKGLINVSSSNLDGVALCFLCLLVYAMIPWRTSLLPATFFFLFGLVFTRYDVYARIYIPSSPATMYMHIPSPYVLLSAFFTHLLLIFILFLPPFISSCT